MKSFDLKRLLSELRLPAREEFRTLGEKARHDWKTILISFFIAVAGLIITHSLLFVRVDRGELLNPVQEEASLGKVIDGEDLEEAVTFFEKRQGDFEMLREARADVVDPSW